MSNTTVSELIEALNQKTPYLLAGSGATPPMRLACQVAPPVPWDKNAIESSLDLRLPAKLIQLWNDASELRLMEDVTYGQWGCILWSPNQALAKHREATGFLSRRDFRPGDFIVGEFRGDPELVIVRCDPSAADYGSVVITMAMDPRYDWPTVAPSIVDFISQFIADPNRKYWEA